MLHIAPQLVQMNAAVPRTNVPTYEWAEADLLRASRASLFRTMREMTPSGAFGEPRGASAEKGKQIADIVCEALVTILHDLAKNAK
jgi:creatinine amidohydrolase